MKLSETGRRTISFPDKYAAFRHHVSLFSSLPGLRGLWTANHLAANGDWEDWTKYDLMLTANGTPGFNYSNNLATYISFDGANDYFSRADEAALDITGTESHIDTAAQGLTVGGWFWSSDAANAQYLASKLGAAGNYSWDLAFRADVAGDPVRFEVTDDGTVLTAVDSAGTMATSVWSFVVGRYCDNNAGEELAVFLNGVKTTGVAAEASIFSGNGPFEVGSGNGGTGKFSGAIAVVFLCAAALNDDMIGAAFQQSRALYGV